MSPLCSETVDIAPATIQPLIGIAVAVCRYL